MPEVSIVIPTFNRASLVRRAIDTALQQTIACEVIVCDHGSTDNTPDIVRSYGQSVTYLRRERDHGPFFAWLDGVINATGKYVHITFDDDWVDPTFIEKCMRVMDDQCAFAFSNATVHYADGGTRDLFTNLFPTGIHSAKRAEAILLGKALAISPGCALFRRSDAIGAMMTGGLPGRTASYHGAGSDLLMFLLPLLSYRKFGFVNEPLSHFLHHPSSITVDASSESSKAEALKRAYRETKWYYLALKFDLRWGLGSILYSWSIFTNKISAALHRGVEK